MKYVLENNSLKVTIQSKGAELTSVIKQNSGKEYLWHADPSFWNRHAPVLFPVVGKLKGNSYIHQGKKYQLSQHGFARDMEFPLNEKSKSKIAFRLTDDKETLQKYPFNFVFDCSYELIESTITVSYNIYNNGPENMYFSVGAHPAFLCPLNEEEKFEDYYLEFNKAETAARYLLTDGLFNGQRETVLENTNILPLTYSLFEKDAIVFKNLQSTEVMMRNVAGSGIKISFPGFPYLGIWTKQIGAPFLCIEPWYGLADSIQSFGELSEKEGIINLMPHQTFQSQYSIKVY